MRAPSLALLDLNPSFSAQGSKRRRRPPMWGARGGTLNLGRGVAT